MWCPRCQRQVRTWAESYVQDSRLITHLLCEQCNAVLQRKEKAVKEVRTHETIQS